MLFSSLTARLARRPVTAQHHSFPPDRSPGSQQLKIYNLIDALNSPTLLLSLPCKKTFLGFPLLHQMKHPFLLPEWRLLFKMGLLSWGCVALPSYVLFQAWWILYLFFNLWAFPDHLSLAVSTLSPSSVASPTCRASLRCLPTSLRPYHTWG